MSIASALAGIMELIVSARLSVNTLFLHIKDCHYYFHHKLAHHQLASGWQLRPIPSKFV